MSLLHTNKTKACGKAEASSIRLLLALIFVSCFLCSCTVEHTLSHCRLNYIRCLFADWLSLSVDRLSVCSHVCPQYNVHALSLRVHSSVCVSVPGCVVCMKPASAEPGDICENTAASGTARNWWKRWWSRRQQPPVHEPRDKNKITIAEG